MQSFGFVPAGTRYVEVEAKSLQSGSDPIYNYDSRANMFGEDNVNLKAMNTQTGGAGTAGYALIPVYVDPKIIDQSRKYTPLTEIIPRVTNRGMTADYNVITAKGAAFVAAEGSALDAVDDTYDRASKPIKFLYSLGETTGQAQAAVPSYVVGGFQPSGSASHASSFGDSNAPNAMQLEVLVKARALKELEENLLINGSVSSDPNEFDGFITLISTTNKVDKNTSALSLEDINTAVQYAYDDGGRPSIAVCSSSVYSDILNLLQQRIGYMQSQQQVFWGFQSIVLHTMVGNVTVIPSMFMSNVSGSKAIYFLDLSVIEVRVLQDMTYERLAKTRDTEKFMLKMYETLIIRAPAFCSWIGEIA